MFVNGASRLDLTDFDLHVVVEEDVPQLQVSVNDPVVVQVMDPFEKLCHVVASFRFSHSLTALVQLQQGLEEKIIPVKEVITKNKNSNSKSPLKGLLIFSEDLGEGRLGPLALLVE